MNSFNLLRSCARASSSRPLARPGLRAFQGRVLPPRRYYSENGDKPKDESKAEESKPQESSENKADCSEIETKLKAKEDEASDLKVRDSTRNIATSLTSRTRAGYNTFTLTS